jgi:hypothetical protein
MIRDITNVAANQLLVLEELRLELYITVLFYQSEDRSCLIMRFLSIVSAYAVLSGLFELGVAEHEKGLRTRSLFKDDASYWSRLLAKGRPTYESSMPTPPPTPRPTLKSSPTSIQTDLPTYATPVSTTPSTHTSAPTPWYVPTISSPGPASPIVTPDDDCAISVHVECFQLDATADCNSIPTPHDQCMEEVFKMAFRYNGGSCDQSTSLLQCQDMNGGPPTVAGKIALVEVTDVHDETIHYFSFFVPVGGRFEMANNGTLLPSKVNVTIYSAPTSTAGRPSFETMLQTMILDTSCSQPTFLTDKAGSLQLLSFDNSAQGHVSCLMDVGLRFHVMSGYTTYALDALYGIANFEGRGVLNLTEIAVGSEVSSSIVAQFSTIVTIDLSLQKKYSIYSVVNGTTVSETSSEEHSCSGTNFYNFTASTA